MLFWCFSSTENSTKWEPHAPTISKFLRPLPSFFFASVPFSCSPPSSLFPCHLLLFPVIILWICINQPLCMLVRLSGCTTLSPTLQFITRVVSFTVKEMCKCIQLILVRRDECGNLLPSPSLQSPSIFPLFFHAYSLVSVRSFRGNQHLQETPHL